MALAPLLPPHPLHQPLFVELPTFTNHVQRTSRVVLCDVHTGEPAQPRAGIRVSALISQILVVRASVRVRLNERLKRQTERQRQREICQDFRQSLVFCTCFSDSLCALHCNIENFCPTRSLP